MDLQSAASRILTTVIGAGIVGLIVWSNNTSARVTTLEVEQKNQQMFNKYVNESIREDLKELSDKLDKLIRK